MSHDGHRRGTVIITTVYPADPSYFSETFLQGSPYKHSFKLYMTDPMTVRRTHDKPSRGPSCFTVSIEMSLHLDSFIYFVSFCLFCLLLLVLISIPYRYYLLWHQNKIESTHVGDRSLSPRQPAWPLDLMMSVTPSTCPKELPPNLELHVLPKQHPKSWPRRSHFLPVL